MQKIGNFREGAMQFITVLFLMAPKPMIHARQHYIHLSFACVISLAAACRICWRCSIWYLLLDLLYKYIVDGRRVICSAIFIYSDHVS